MTSDKLKPEEKVITIPEGLVVVPPDLQIKYPSKEEQRGSTKEESEQEESTGEISGDKEVDAP